MKRKLIATFVTLLSVMVMCFAQRPYKIMFYNMENFFDTIDDPTVHDEEFLPNGAKRWNTAKYEKKLHNMERVIRGVATANTLSFPIVIGVAEVENRSVLEDIVSTQQLVQARYDICHYDSPDARGVDVAFLYRPDIFKKQGSYNFRVNIPSLPNFRTRGIVAMWGTIEEEPFYFMVAHWPSRLGGQEASAFKRNAVGAQMRAIADSVLQVNPATHVICMGDFNDDPTDASVAEYLGAKGKIKELKEGDFFNPFTAMLKSGMGTLAYRDAWNIFDNIVLTENLVHGAEGKFRLVNKSHTKYYGNIYKPNYLMQQDGQYKGYPLRTFSGNNFLGGYSDHLPVFIYIDK
jgi:hypothetical protein